MLRVVGEAEDIAIRAFAMVTMRRMQGAHSKGDREVVSAAVELVSESLQELRHILPQLQAEGRSLSEILARVEEHEETLGLLEMPDYPDVDFSAQISADVDNQLRMQYDSAKLAEKC